MTRRPMYRIRYMPTDRKWLVSPTRHAPAWVLSAALCPTWASAIEYANRKAREHADREAGRYPKGGVVPPITNTGIPARTSRGRIEQNLRDADHQIGWLADPDELWDQDDPGRTYDLNAGGIANLTYEIKPGPEPGFVHLEPAPPWARNYQNRKN